MRHWFKRATPTPTPQVPPNPFETAAEIPNRILEIHRAFEINIVESVQALEQFGVRTLEDLADPRMLLQNINSANLMAFAQQYETELKYLITGMGRIHRPTHAHVSPMEIAIRIMECWTSNDLRGVYFVSNRDEPRLDQPTPITVVIKRKHPRLETHTLMESWPSIRWDGPGRVLVMTLIQWCVENHRATGDFCLYPQGLSIDSAAHDSWNDGSLHLASAMQHPVFSWHPESTLREFSVAIPDLDPWTIADFARRMESLRRIFKTALDQKSTNRN
jgi:hypothetical protein